MIESYTAVIRLQLEYAAEVWDPHLQKNVELLVHVENVHKQACVLDGGIYHNALLEQFH